MLCSWSKLLCFLIPCRFRRDAMYRRRLFDTVAPVRWQWMNFLHGWKYHRQLNTSLEPLGNGTWNMVTPLWNQSFHLIEAKIVMCGYSTGPPRTRQWAPSGRAETGRVDKEGRGEPCDSGCKSDLGFGGKAHVLVQGHTRDWRHALRLCFRIYMSCLSTFLVLYNCPCPGPEHLHSPRREPHVS